MRLIEFRGGSGANDSDGRKRDGSEFHVADSAAATIMWIDHVDEIQKHRYVGLTCLSQRHWLPTCR
jgi:hypothetical protein